MIFNKDRNMINGMSLVKSLMALAIAIFLAQSSFAQDDDLGGEPAGEEAAASPAAPAEKPLQGTPVQTTKSGQPKRTTIDFEDELVEGKTKNPELFYLLQKRQFNYKRLIRLRENFLPEMRKTSEDMQRKGSTQGEQQ
jgi:hypothetical protein